MSMYEFKKWGVCENLHPTPWQMYPGMQQPPPRSCGQLVAPEGHLPTLPPQVDPFGQQAILPTDGSFTSVQYVPCWQHLLGEFDPEQSLMPLGQVALFCKTDSACAARRKILSSLSSKCLANEG